MKEKVAVRIVIDVEMDLNSTPKHLVYSGITNQLNARFKKLLNQAWEDWDGNDPTINSINVDVSLEDI